MYKVFRSVPACHMGSYNSGYFTEIIVGAFSYSIYILKCLICIMLWKLWMSVF